jgi:hypothetical protein
MSKKSKRKGKSDPSNAQQEIGEKNMQNTEVKVHGAVEVHPSQDSKTLHNTERQEDTSQRGKEYSLAQWSLIVAIAALAISTLYFVATALIVWQSKKSADAATSAAHTADATLKSSQDQFRTDQRPYVFASPEHGNEILTPMGIQPQYEKHFPDGRGQIQIVVKVNNGGKSPAVNALSTKSQMYTASTRDEVTRKFQEFVPEYFPGHTDILASGVEHVMPTGDWTILSRTEYEKLRRKELFVYVVGAVKYTDVFQPPLGTPYETTYCFLYLPPPGLPFGGCGGSIK